VEGGVMQSRAMSFVEAVATIGYILAIITQLGVFPSFRIRTTLSENLRIGFIFTFVSFARSYVLRRLFNSASKGPPAFRCALFK